MENDQGVLVDLYVPRKCAATSKRFTYDECPETRRSVYVADRLITSKDHASVQINVADVDASGRALSTYTSFALCGQVRSQGESDDSVNRLATKAGCEQFLLWMERRADGFTFGSCGSVGRAVLRNVFSYQK